MVELTSDLSNPRRQTKRLVSAVRKIRKGTMRRVEEPDEDIRGEVVGEVSKRELTRPEIDEAVRRFSNGESTVSIADGFGVDRRRVRAALHEVGVLKRKSPLSRAQIAHAIYLYKEGASLEAVGRDLGVAANTVRKRLLEAGVATRPRPGSVRLSDTA